MSQKIQSKVLNIQNLTDDTFILSIENPNIEYEAGQYMILNFPGEKESREFSIYNKHEEKQLQFLIREVKDGYLSSKLKKLKKGDIIEITGPFGFFTIPKAKSENQKYYFIATGTGISPIHSILTTYPNTNHKLIHGIRFPQEKYQYQNYGTNYKACVSGIKSKDFNGRVTNYLKTIQLPTDAQFYLSGNSAMINEITDYLFSKQISFDKINTEIYF